MNRIQIPEAAGEIIRILNEAGYEAYAVGGCVRDSLMGRVPKDWDVTTSARPEAIKSLFPRTFDTGIQHGTVTVRMYGESFEVTTYRVDQGYSDHRRPDSVRFSRSLKEDLLRRDFTINAMAYHPEEGLVDLYGGMKDLEAGVIRCVGQAEERFQEDALRMLRALRFSAQLNFRIEEHTWTAITALAPQIRYVSWERIREEMNQLLLSDHPETLRSMYQTGLLHSVMPEWEACFTTPQNHPYHIYTVGEHMIVAMQSIAAEPVLRWTMLLHDIGKPDMRTTDDMGVDHFVGHVGRSVSMADTILRRLKFDNASRERILRLIQYHEVHPRADKRAMRRLIARVGMSDYPDLLKVQEADARAKNPEFAARDLLEIEKVRTLLQEIIEDGDAVSLAQLAISGRDLIRLGFAKGPDVGQTLKTLLEDVLEHPEHNEKEYLLKEAKRILARKKDEVQ